jgi:hypothetical protein
MMLGLIYVIVPGESILIASAIRKSLNTKKKCKKCFLDNKLISSNQTRRIRWKIFTLQWLPVCDYELDRKKWCRAGEYSKRIKKRFVWLSWWWENMFFYIKKSSLFCPRNDAPASCGQIRGATGYNLFNLWFW